MAVLVALLLGGVVVTLAVGYWRAVHSDARSVEAYHTRLERLAHIGRSEPEDGSSADASAHVRIVDATRPRQSERRPQIGRPVGPAPVASIPHPPSWALDDEQPSPEPLVASEPLVAAPEPPAAWPEPAAAAPDPTVTWPEPAAAEPLIAAVPPAAPEPLIAVVPPVAPEPPDALEQVAASPPRVVFFDDLGAGGPAPKSQPVSPPVSPLLATAFAGLDATGPGRKRASRARGPILRRPSPRTAARAGVAAVVLLVVAGTAVAIERGRTHHTPRPGPSAARPTHRTTIPPTQQTTPTTSAPSVTPVLSSRSPMSASYSISGGSVALSMVATGRCWVQLRAGSANGPLVYQGILNSGDHKSFSALPGLWLRLGYPVGVGLQLDGVALTLPASASPYDVTVETASPASVGTA